MLSIEQYKIIDDQLAKESASEFVKMLIVKYGSTVETIGELLSYIPKLAEKQLKIKQNRINQYSWGMDLMIGDRYIHPGKYKKDDSHMRFVTLFFTCKAHFISGNIKYESKAGKEFFCEFIEMLKDKKEFNYTKEDDWNWIYTTAGGADWLETVIKQNIDSNFVKPKNTRITCKSYKDIW